MTETTLALADVVALLNEGGWQATGGAAKYRFSPLGETLIITRVWQPGERELSFDYQRSDRPGETKSFHLGDVVRCAYSDTCPDMLKIWGTRQIQQMYPIEKGGGTYHRSREVRELTLQNLTQWAIAQKKREDDRIARTAAALNAREALRRLSSDRLTGEFGGKTLERIEVQEFGRIEFWFADGYKLVVDAAMFTDPDNLSLIWLLNGLEVPVN